jgi:hypothetical protein
MSTEATSEALDQPSTASSSKLLRWIDIGTKLATATMIPIIAFFFDNQLKLQTEAVQRQNLAFEQFMQTRDKNIDLTLKFYEVISSKKLECYDESTGPLLKVFIDTNNQYNQVQMDYEQIASSLARSSLKDPNCKASEDAKSIIEEKRTIPEDYGAHGILPATAYPDGVAGDGWVAVGHYHDKSRAFTNFTILAPHDDHIRVLEPGNIIQATSVVYLRYNHNDTVVADNRIVGLLSEGTCAIVKKSMHLRGQTWAWIVVQPTCTDGRSG